MKQLSDKLLAERMLQARASGGHKFLPFLGMNAKGYILLVLFFSALLAILGFVGCWPAFFVVAGVLVGVFLRDASWLTSLQRTWPFSVKVIDWDKVQRIANAKPLV